MCLQISMQVWHIVTRIVYKHTQSPFVCTKSLHTSMACHYCTLPFALQVRPMVLLRIMAKEHKVTLLGAEQYVCTNTLAFCYLEAVGS